MWAKNIRQFDQNKFGLKIFDKNCSTSYIRKKDSMNKYSKQNNRKTLFGKNILYKDTKTFDKMFTTKNKKFSTKSFDSKYLTNKIST